MIERRWINQPSKKQALHKHHGENVLCDAASAKDGVVDVYPTAGPIVSMRVPLLSLSKGWKP